MIVAELRTKRLQTIEEIPIIRTIEKNATLVYSYVKDMIEPLIKGQSGRPEYMMITMTYVDYSVNVS